MARSTYGEPNMLDAALDALSADDLRGVIRRLVPWMDDQMLGRLKNDAIALAARAGQAPASPSEARIAAIEAFAVEARRMGDVEPAGVDRALRQGANAFLARDYPAAFRIFRALLIPIAEAEIYLGEDELVDEVLGVDPADCACQFVVAMYMTAAPKRRAVAVLAAIEQVESVGYFFEPLAQMERIAVEPLPGFDAFLPEWRAVVEKRIADGLRPGRNRHEHRWLCEVVLRTEGANGLGVVARASKRPDDLRAWCNSLQDAGEWEAACAAYAEAAEMLEEAAYERAEFLDGVALAAQELGADDLDEALEQAWRTRPTLTRLRRLLAGAATKDALKARAARLLADAPDVSGRQRAMLLLICGELAAVAEQLAQAPGLGWSDSDHPGHIVFPILARLLGATSTPIGPLGIDDLDDTMPDDRPKLRAPTIDALLSLANLEMPASARPTLVEAMRTAAEKRLDGVTDHGRRRHYDHAASLAVGCAMLDGTADGIAWLQAMRDAYRRYPALQRAFDEAQS